MNKESGAILLVEGNPYEAEMTMNALRSSGLDIDIKLARDGVEAIAFARIEPPPKLVLLDLKMPKIDGLEVLATLKRDERTHRIPIVILTSSRQEGDVLEAYRAGANGYVVKPADIDAFNAVVGALGTYWLNLNRVPRL